MTECSFIILFCLSSLLYTTFSHLAISSNIKKVFCPVPVFINALRRLSVTSSAFMNTSIGFNFFEYDLFYMTLEKMRSSMKTHDGRSWKRWVYSLFLVVCYRAFPCYLSEWFSVRRRQAQWPHRWCRRSLRSSPRPKENTTNRAISLLNWLNVSHTKRLTW